MVIGILLIMKGTGLGLINETTPMRFTFSSATLFELFFIDNRSRALLYDQLSASVLCRHILIFLSYDFKIFNLSLLHTFLFKRVRQLIMHRRVQFSAL